MDLFLGLKQTTNNSESVIFLLTPYPFFYKVEKNGTKSALDIFEFLQVSNAQVFLKNQQVLFHTFKTSQSIEMARLNNIEG